ncbi:O-antigen ligase family protein [Rickettsiales bacterium]|nr:O-antigen ligase family protein [Rickettsiales bacterium]
MTQLLKISCVLLGISFSLRLHTPIAFGLCVLIPVLIIFFEKRKRINEWVLKAKETKLIFFLLPLVISFGLSSLNSIEISRSFPVIFYLFTYMFFSYILFFFFKENKEALTITSVFIIISVCFSTILVTAYNCFEYFSIPEWYINSKGNITSGEELWSGEVRRFKGFSNLLVLLICLCPFFEKIISNKKIFISYFIFPLIIPIIYLGNVNSAALGLLSGTILISIYRLLMFSERPKKKLTIIATLSLLTLSFILNVLVKQYESSPIAKINFIIPTSIVDAHRQIIWGFSLSKYKNKPLLGIGPDSSNFMKGSQENIGHPSTGDMNYIPSHPHNFFIELLLETGLLGILTFSSLIIYVNYYIAKRYSRLSSGYLIFFNGYFWGSSLVNFSFWASWWQGSYFLILAIIFSAMYNEKERRY